MIKPQIILIKLSIRLIRPTIRLIRPLIRLIRPQIRLTIPPNILIIPPIIYCLETFPYINFICGPSYIIFSKYLLVQKLQQCKAGGSQMGGLWFSGKGTTGRVYYKLGYPLLNMYSITQNKDNITNSLFLGK